MFSKLLLAMLFITTRLLSQPGASEQPVVRAILFYSPTCGHCHFVIREALPVLMDQYKERLEILGIDVTQPQGQIFFDSAREMFGLESTGVPFLVVGDEYLVGSSEIPNKFPALIEKYLAEGGVDWPAIQGLRDAVQAAQTSQASTPITANGPSIPAADSEPVIGETSVQTSETFVISESRQTSVWQRVAQDPIGNGLAILVLLSMVMIVVRAILSFRSTSPPSDPRTLQLLIPTLCFIGLGVAGYLTYVETTQQIAVCGPVGDCNAVQQSEYAILFGILPIGVLGIAGYLLILLGWRLGKARNESISVLGKLATFGLCTFGIALSIYLTFLEPFVIGATCAWCLASAIIMSLLFILMLPDGKNSFSKLASLSLPAIRNRKLR